MLLTRCGRTGGRVVAARAAGRSQRCCTGAVNAGPICAAHVARRAGQVRTCAVWADGVASAAGSGSHAHGRSAHVPQGGVRGGVRWGPGRVQLLRPSRSVRRSRHTQHQPVGATRTQHGAIRLCSSLPQRDSTVVSVMGAASGPAHATIAPEAAAVRHATALAAGVAAQCRGFEVEAANVDVLQTPGAFYDALMRAAGLARRRITLASLYVGTGDREKRLVEQITTAAQAHPELQVTVMVDHSRGTRLVKGQAEGGQHTAGEHPGSQTMLRPLVDAVGPARARLTFFQMPQLQGRRKAGLPARYKEGIAVSHLKAYVFDDTVILSGANLSNDYFTDRQDRYIVFRDTPQLADYFDGLVRTLSEAAWVLDPSAPGGMRPSPHMDPQTLKVPGDVLRGLLQPFASPPASHEEAGLHVSALNPAGDLDDSMADSGDSEEVREETRARTVVYPSVQFAAVGLRQDEQVTRHVLRKFAPHHHMHMASGYFNFPKHYQHLLLNNRHLKGSPERGAAVARATDGWQGRPQVAVLTAAPEANGFWTAKQVAAALPLAYSQLEKRFYNACKAAGVADTIRLHEYQRDGWTFHGKGLWLTPVGDQRAASGTDGAGSADPAADGDSNDDAPHMDAATIAPVSSTPIVTMVGSPNFGRRSVERDLEAQVTLVTTDPVLRAALGQERDALFSHSEQVDDSVWQRPGRRLGGWSWNAGAWIHLGHRIVARFL